MADRSLTQAPMQNTLAASVAKWTTFIGFPLFAIGYVGPILVWPRNNMGPLLGIFVTGPVGVTIGSAVGTIVWARQTPARDDRDLFHILAFFWLCTLLYTLLGFRIMPKLAFVGVLCQLLLVAAFIVQFSISRRTTLLVLVLAASLVAAVCLFPPAAPHRAFILDHGYVLNRQRLLAEWLVIIAAGAGSLAAMKRKS